MVGTWSKLEKCGNTGLYTYCKVEDGWKTWVLVLARSV
jgi:hypothetical protein